MHPDYGSTRSHETVGESSECTIDSNSTTRRFSKIRKKYVLAVSALVGCVLMLTAGGFLGFADAGLDGTVNKGPECKDCMAVASDNDVCTKIGAETLRQGGSGVDATIAILLCLGAVQPQSNGIGGGGFMLVHTKTEDKVINFREKAPAAATPDMYVDRPDLAQRGGLASAVPGEVRGYWTAHQMYGKLPWKDLFTPSIKILRAGIEVSHHLENTLKGTRNPLPGGLPGCFQTDYFKSMFFNGEDLDSYKKVGETYTNTKLADTYEKIAREGPDGFYKGEIAENIVKAIKDRSGIMSVEDLEGYNVTIDEPFKFKYRGQTIISAPPPASGHVTAIALKVLENFDLASFGYGTLKAWNHILEAMRSGYAMRGLMGDPLFSQKTKEVVDMVKSGAYEKELIKHFKDTTKKGLINPHTNYNDYLTHIYHFRDNTHTTHVSVLGPEGEAVSCTSTVNLLFGSCVMTEDGIVLNDEMDDFSTPGFKNNFGFDPSPENYIEAGKRPMSSSCPTITFGSNGEANFVTGAAGGSRIISGALLSIINALDWNMPLATSLREPRIHDQLNGFTYYEVLEGIRPVDQSLVSGLKSLGYNMTSSAGKLKLGDVTSVSRLHGDTSAAGDPRKNGTGIVLLQPIKS